MKTFIQTLLWVWLLTPVVARAQHVTDYRPNGGLLVSSVVNLESLRGSNPVVDPVPGFTRSVNTVQEAAGAAPNDIWFLTSDQAGNVVNSWRYGDSNNINERASAIEYCLNGDYIILGITTIGGLDRILAFRINAAGVVLWSMVYGAPNASTRGYCIKRTNDAAESYIITGSLVQGGLDKTLVALKINGGGGMIWNFTYFDPVVPNNIFDQPRSMAVVGNNHYIAGNRTQGALQNIFTIAIDQVAGGIVIQYSHIDNGGLPDINPYINSVIGGGFVLAYTNVLGGANTRVAYTPLNAALVPAAATTLYWEAGTTNNYGHSIYQNGGFFDIAGGVTTPAQRNPTFFTINPAGVFVAGSYRRLWAAQAFASTFMLLDPFGAAANRYAHHNFRPAGAAFNGMSVMRNNAVCFVAPMLQSVVINNQWFQQQYITQVALQQQGYGIPRDSLHGIFVACAGGGGGVFKTPVKGKEEREEGSFAFKVYPSLVTSSSHVTVELESPKDGNAFITIYSMEARAVLQTREILRKGNNRINIDMKTVPRGTFIVEIKTDDHVLKARIIKQ